MNDEGCRGVCEHIGGSICGIEHSFCDAAIDAGEASAVSERSDAN